VARIYAGILGLLAFLTSMAHGVVHARATEALLLTAWWNLLVFAVLGSVIGWIAARIVEDSVSAAVARQLEAEKASEKVEPAQPAASAGQA